MELSQKIQVRRGEKQYLPELDSGEFGLAVDTKEVFIGTPTGNQKVTMDFEFVEHLADETAHGIDGVEADLASHKADTANYYVPPFTVPATDGTGEINAATITSAE